MPIVRQAPDLRDNTLIKRGGATNATQTIAVTRRFKLIGNHIAGFDEIEASAQSARQTRTTLVALCEKSCTKRSFFESLVPAPPGWICRTKQL